MNGQMNTSQERLGALTSTTSNWFASLTPCDQITGLLDTVVPATEEKNLLGDDTALGTEVDNKVKTKLLTMWHNVKYGWTSKLKTNFSKESPVWLLGASYHKKAESPETASEAGGFDTDSSGDISIAEDATNFDEGMEGFKRDFVSRLWLTYRREFPILNGSTFTSDCGWGCMLRSGQMMLAQALVCHFLGRAWRWRPDQPIQTHQQFAEESKHRMIIKWFGDQPATQSPFSIHTLVSLGVSTGKRAGDWYGPASVAHLLDQAIKAAVTRHEELENITVYVAQDCAVEKMAVLPMARNSLSKNGIVHIKLSTDSFCTCTDEHLYLDDVRRSCERPDGTWRSLVLLVPLRLGADKLNSGYGPCLTALLSLDVCIGVIGGRPRHSLYFIGYQEDKLIHLDPHYCQEAVDVWKHNFSLASFHCSSPRKMLLSKMDPSCCVGFYLHDRKSLENFIKIVEPFLVPPNQKVEYPMFLFCEGSGHEMRQGYEELPSPTTNLRRSDDVHCECEEFEVL